MTIDTLQLEQTLKRLCVRAGAEIMRINSEGFTLELKEDQSPVTLADQTAEAVILKGLKSVFPKVPVVAEEKMSAGERVIIDDLFFLVDPLDGTKEFIAKREDFTVNIGLIHNGIPIYGCVYAPARGTLYYGGGTRAFRCQLTDREVITGQSDYTNCIQMNPSQENRNLTIVASRSHMSDETRNFISQYEDAELLNIGSSLKFCMLAEGKADLYPRYGPTMEWDTAAGDAILRATGGTTRLLDKTVLTYGDKNPLTPREYENGYFISYAAIGNNTPTSLINRSGDASAP